MAKRPSKKKTGAAATPAAAPAPRSFDSPNSPGLPLPLPFKTADRLVTVYYPGQQKPEIGFLIGDVVMPLSTILQSGNTAVITFAAGVDLSSLTDEDRQRLIDLVNFLLNSQAISASGAYTCCP